MTGELRVAIETDEAVKKQCLRGEGSCKSENCMAWLWVDPNDDKEGVCMYLGVTTAIMKVMHLWSQMITASKSNIVR